LGKNALKKTPASFSPRDLNTVGATTAEKKIIVPLHIEIIIIIGFIPIDDLRCHVIKSRINYFGTFLNGNS
jgi:hypothetical protein